MSSNIQTFEIPLYIERVKLSNAKRKKYYVMGKKLPPKYGDQFGKLLNTENYEWRKIRGKKLLVDKRTNEPIVKNPSSAGKPNYQHISGNDILAKVHERVRIAMIEGIKDNFLPHLPKKLTVKFPILMEMEMHTTPKQCDWDLDNLWLYCKALQDLMKREGLIPDDNVKYITKPISPRFIPVTRPEQRKLVISMIEDDDYRIQSHVMFDLNNPKKAVIIERKLATWHMQAKRGLMIEVTTGGSTGDLSIEMNERVAYINVGKKKLVLQAAHRILGKIFSQGVQLNSIIIMNQKDYDYLESLVQKEILDRGLQVYVIKNPGFEK